MPIGIICNAAAVILGGFIGTLLGPRLSEDRKSVV